MTDLEMNQLDRKLAKLVGWHLVETTHEDGTKTGEWYSGEKYTGYDAYLIGADGEYADLECKWSPTRRIEQALGDGEEGTVVGELRKRGWGLSRLKMILRLGCEAFFKQEFVGVLQHREIKSAYANTPSLAICKAADAVLESMKEEE